jgi:hypothetical protein
MAVGGNVSLAGWNFCPNSEPDTTIRRRECTNAATGWTIARRASSRPIEAVLAIRPRRGYGCWSQMTARPRDRYQDDEPSYFSA